MGDFDALNSPEFSTGYVPTTLLVEDGKVVEKFAGNNCKLVPSLSTPARTSPQDDIGIAIFVCALSFSGRPQDPSVCRVTRMRLESPTGIRHDDTTETDRRTTQLTCASADPNDDLAFNLAASAADGRRRTRCCLVLR